MPTKKDPNKPKGPTSAYLFFLQHRRREAKEAGEKIDFTKFSQECSASWKDMDDDDKADYFKQAEEDKKRYQKEMESYVPPAAAAAEDGDSGRKRGKKGGKAGKKAKDKNAPKRAMSGFMFFCSAKRPEFKKKNPSASVGDLAKLLGAAWNKLSADDRKPYEAKAKEDQQRYKEEKEAYSRGEFGREDEEDVNEDEEESDED